MAGKIPAPSRCVHYVRPAVFSDSAPTARLRPCLRAAATGAGSVRRAPVRPQCRRVVCGHTLPIRGHHKIRHGLFGAGLHLVPQGHGNKNYRARSTRLLHGSLSFPFTNLSRGILYSLISISQQDHLRPRLRAPSHRPPRTFPRPIMSASISETSSSSTQPAPVQRPASSRVPSVNLHGSSAFCLPDAPSPPRRFQALPSTSAAASVLPRSKGFKAAFWPRFAAFRAGLRYRSPFRKIFPQAYALVQTGISFSMSYEYLRSSVSVKFQAFRSSPGPPSPSVLLN